MSLALAWVLSRLPTGSVHTTVAVGGPFWGREPAGAQLKEQAWRPLGVKASERVIRQQAELQHPESWIGLPPPPGISLGIGAYLFGSSTNLEKHCPEIYF